MNESLRVHIEQISKLPTLPVIAQEILSLVEDDLVSVNQLTGIIKTDPAISAKIMSTANSAFFGFREPARTLDNAIVRIGFDCVKNIALGISVMTILGNGKCQCGADYRRVFNHSVTVAFIGKMLGRRFRPDISAEILICGLLHDIGLLIMSRYFSGKFTDMLSACEEDETLLEAERHFFGFTHADIGYWAAETWKLPDTVTDTVLYHHEPAFAARINLQHVALVHIADYIATRHVLSSTPLNLNYVFDPYCLELTGISEDDLKHVVSEVKNGSLFNGLFLT